MRIRIFVSMFAMYFVALVVAVPAIAADSAEYRVTIQLDWSSARFPYQYPKDPHFSRVIGMTHNSKYSLFADGDTASSGLALVATNGRTSILKAELGEALRRRRVGMIHEGDALKAGVGTVVMTIQVTEAHNRFSFVTMVAPSPDWITGRADSVLNPNGVWVESLELPMWVWDAGVDSGQTLNAPNAPVQPRESVRLAANPYFLYRTGLKPIGSVVFTRTK